MEFIADHIVKKLIKLNLKISTAESCTGGLLSSAITAVPNSSKIFELGICSYSNRVKSQLLKVPEITLMQKGAVSKETAEYMSMGIKKISDSDIGVSTTGIAGPTGATKEKPIGLVFVSVATNQGTITKKFLIENIGRDYIRKETVKRAIDLIEFVIK